jgi:RecA/RadA recombinase
VVELYGPEGAGKTAVALKLLKSAQAADMLVAWVATDVPPSPESLAWIGVDLERLAIARQTWATPGLELAQLLLEAGVDQVAIDSVACLLGPDPEASLAAVLNQGLPALSGAAERTGGRVVLVNQERLAGGRGHIPLPAGFCPADDPPGADPDPAGAGRGPLPGRGAPGAPGPVYHRAGRG